MRHRFQCRVLLAVLFGLVVGVTPARAGVIGPGFDLFHTPSGTALLPPVAGLLPAVQLMSRPIPGLGDTDTIVQRTAGFSCLSPCDATIPIELVALSLESVAPVEISGSFFDVFVTINALGLSGLPLTPGLQPSLGMMTIHDRDSAGGTFDSFFDVFVEIELVDPATGGIVMRLPGEAVHIEGLDNPWSRTAPPGYPDDPRFPSGDFYPGPTTHTGPHPSVVPATVPEPDSFVLLGSGLMLALAARRWNLLA